MTAFTPPLQSLMDADPTGWTRVSGPGRVSEWGHRNGLHLVVERMLIDTTPTKTPGWKADFSIDGHILTVEVLRTRPRNLEGSLTPLLHDIKAWIQALDLVPRAKIAHTLAAWLLFHEKTGSFKISLQEYQQYVAELVRRTPQGVREMISPPPDLIQILRPDIDRFWACAPLPIDNYFHVFWLPNRDDRLYVRRLNVEIPTSMHARMEMLASMDPRLRHIPLPDPA